MNAKTLRDLSPAQLKNYIDRGILHVTMKETTLPMCIEDTPEFQLFKKLKGKGIGIAEAARKYNVTQASVTRWKQRGFIPVIGHDGPQKILVDQAHVAYCAYVYHLSPGKGKWVFNKNGTPRPQGIDLRNN